MPLLGAKLARAALMAAVGFAAMMPAHARTGVDDVTADTEAAADDGTTITSRTNETLQLAVVINDRSMGMIGEFVIRGGQLFSRREELLSVGIRVPASVRADGDLIALTGVPGFAARIDYATQTIYITAGDDWVVPTTVGELAGPIDYVFEGSPGATLNYDLIGRSVDGKTMANGSLDFRAFSRFGVFSTGVLFYANSDLKVHGHDGFKTTRLDTSYVYSDPMSLRRYRLGDLITGGLPWTRPVRLGGAQVNSDFSMRPDLITFPVPQVAGSAAVPSTVDVLVNSTRVISGAIPSGPFSVPQVPVISGAGTVTTTVTDALGRQIVTETPFYTTSALLSPNLQTYSGEVGFVRRNWGILSQDYGDLAGSATYRRGLTPWLTVEAHAEGSKGLAMGGIGGVANLFDFAVVNFAAAASRHGGRSAGQVSAGIDRISPVFSFGASVIAADRHFADIASLNGDTVTTLQFNLHAGLSLKKLGSLGLAYTETKQAGVAAAPMIGPPDPTAASAFARSPEHSQLLTASYSKQFGRLSFFSTAFRNFTGRKNTTLLVGIALPLGTRTTAGVSAQTASDTRSAQVDLNRSAIVPGDWGFRGFASADGKPAGGAPWIGAGKDHEFGQVTYKSQWGQVYAGVDRTGGSTTVQGELVGAVSLIDHSAFLSNRIDDSFAVVDTGVRGISVQEENRFAGHTDSRGRLIVPGLRAFELNQITIDPLDAPVDADIALTGRSVRPLDRTGVIVKLPVRVAHGAILRIVGADGEPIAVGSSATLRTTNVATPVGYDGEAYLVDLQEHNDVLVDLPDGKRCALIFDYAPKPGDIPSIGPLTCREMVQ